MDVGEKYYIKWNTEHSKSKENIINKYEYFSYTLWTKILERVKDPKNYPNYIGCTVDKRWLNFSNFIKDLPKIPGYDLWLQNLGKDKIHLDKDIKIKGNKEYSFKNCMFVPERINYLILKSDKSRGELPIGVQISKNKYQSRVKLNGKTIVLGNFKDKHSAFLMYKFNKELIIQEIAKEMYDNGAIDVEVYDSLMRYKIEEND